MNDGPSQEGLEHPLWEVKVTEKPRHLEVEVGLRGLHQGVRPEAMPRVQSCVFRLPSDKMSARVAGSSITVCAVGILALSVSFITSASLYLQL